jgi:serine phosphatase RsbU (regulator of sigma subunit)/anti-sigma regulatory factor (Ser/Thr protein kinase)/PAS domain-containing protein
MPDGDLDALALRASGVGLWSFVPGRYTVTIDDVTARLVGAAEPGTFPVADLMGALHPDDRKGLFAALESVSRACQLALRAGGPQGGPAGRTGLGALGDLQVLEEFRVRGDDDTVRWVRLRGGVVLDGTGGAVVTGVAADTTGLRTSRERTGRTLAQVSDGVLILEPDWTVAYVNDTAAGLLGRAGADLVGRAFWDEVPEAEDSPVHVNYHWAMDHQRPVTFETPTATGWLEVRAYPSIDGLTVYLRSVEARHEAERERGRIVTRLERALARGRQLLGLTRSLSTAMTVQDVADAVTTNARRALGTVFAGLALVEKTGRTMEYVSMSPLPAETAAVWSRFPLDRSAPVSDAARHGRPYFHETVEQAVEDFPDIGPHMRTAGTESMAHLPLVTGSGSRLGTLALSWSTEHTMSGEERDFLVTLAGHTAQALERALLFEQQRTVADALQHAVLPDRLPTVPGVTLGAVFVPATGGHEVGGDWYDAFVLPSGRLGLAVGDAAGHGLPAARVMSGLRNALRSYALLGGGPGDVVERLDAFVEQYDPDTFATIAYLELDPATGEGVWCSAGHPPLLRIAPPDAAGTGARATFFGDDVDPPVGSLLARGAREHPFRLDPGETLVLFTDGLVERRDDDLDHGLDRLTATATAVPAELSPPDLVRAICDTLLAGSGPTDDVCLLAVRRGTAAAGRPEDDRSAPGTVVRHVLQPVPSAAYVARSVAREALRSWGLTDLVDTVTLVVSELVTNAVTHAGGEVALEVRRLDDAVRVSVTDTSPDAPQHQDPGPREEHGRGVHLVDVLAARWGTTSLPDGKRVWAELDVP